MGWKALNAWAGKPVVLFFEHVFTSTDYVNLLECLVESMDTRWRGVKVVARMQAPRVVARKVPVPRVVERRRKASQAPRMVAKARKEHVQEVPISVGSVGIIATYLKIACIGLTAVRVVSVDSAASTGEPYSLSQPSEPKGTLMFGNKSIKGCCCHIKGTPCKLEALMIPPGQAFRKKGMRCGRDSLFTFQLWAG